MDVCDEWSLAISVPKSQFGMSRVEYLGHTVSAEGIGAKPKNLDELTRLTFPETIKGIQSFLGSLNYYHRFVEHFAVYAAALYEVTPRDLVLAKTSPEHLATARVAFEVLKKKLAETPILRHFDPERRPIVVIYANDWAVASSLLQENEGSLEPITFCSRVLKQHELKFALAEKEALALLQMLNAQATLLLGRPIKVLTRHSTLAWLMTAKGLQGRLEKWGVMLSPWTIEVERIKKGEDDLTGLVAAAVGPAAKLDEMLQAIRPRKAIRQAKFGTIPMRLDPDEEAWIVSFDGSAKPRRERASCGAVLWRTPGWEIVDAEAHCFEDGTVNEAEYRGLLSALDLARRHAIRRLVVCGDSRLVIQQVRGEMECRSPSLQLLHAQAIVELGKFERVDLIHVARAYNAAADLITGKALQRGSGGRIPVEEFTDLLSLVAKRSVH
ncbi:hypothetical protein P43SY_011081 [Pythium insidiosum]|uniref:Reverse transcriptase n=1 Tax=Pythium insidiosum TaxID=114742 RepID=A0AAD5Q2Z1_PYTIN|nr:hypothetical protein P43SY_011081 [Pythium insidiosum]